MRKYLVRFSRVAVDNLQEAFNWGYEYWGEEAANKWLDDLEMY